VGGQRNDWGGMDEERGKEKFWFPYLRVYHLIPTAESRGGSQETPRPLGATGYHKDASHAGCRTEACVTAGRQRLLGTIARQVQLRLDRCVEIWAFGCVRQVLLVTHCRAGR
jgi:hypothetical protein